MMRPEKAISDLAHIRQRLQLIDARCSFRCFSLVVSASVFIVAALLQPWNGVSADSFSTGFVGYWLAVGLVCSTGIVAEVYWRSMNAGSRITFEWSRQLAASMLPSITVAIVATWALIDQPRFMPMVPGLWALFAGLAIASGSRLLPALSQIAAFWLIVGGTLSIRYNDWVSEHLSLTMIGLFGVGQLILAASLFAGVQSNGQE